MSNKLFNTLVVRIRATSLIGGAGSVPYRNAPACR